MQPFLRLFCLLFLPSIVVAGNIVQTSPQQSLNAHVAFMNHSVDELMHRFQMIQTYYNDVQQYRQTKNGPLRISSSGPLDDYYFKKALASDGLTAAEKQALNAGSTSLWQLLTTIDQTSKALETYIRLNDYQRDNLKQSDVLLAELERLFTQFRLVKGTLYKQIQQIYRHYQPYAPNDAYLYTERDMEQILQNQTKLFDTLTYYLNENSPANWPVELVQQSMMADAKSLVEFGKKRATISYPANDMVSSFKAAIRSIQNVKARGINDNTFAARQNARHGNAFYLSLINYYNNDLLSWQQLFVNNSQPRRQLLAYPKFSPVFAFEASHSVNPTIVKTAFFKDVPAISFTTQPAQAPAEPATFAALNAYIDFINESLRQMNRLQVLLRNYQPSAEYYRTSNPNSRRSGLSYSHEEFKVPVSEHQLLINDSQHIPQPYRHSINSQADVLLSMLKEMDGLSIELIAYTRHKQYEQDHLQRSDAILDRYAYLFDTFDQKKERLYEDVRRIHERYPLKNPSDSWQVAGRALQKNLDENKAILFGIKAYLKGEASQLPPTDKLQANARQLIQDEYQNLKGLKRLGPNNGGCPYTPYEYMAENSLKMAERSQKVKITTSADGRHPYEEFYYFFNNQLVYEYNKFSDLARFGVLKSVNQPNYVEFRRSVSSKPALPTEPIRSSTIPSPTVSSSENTTSTSPTLRMPVGQPIDRSSTQHDTIYVDRTKVDTVYIDRTARQDYTNSLQGYAANNMVLLLDVSASMDSPYKMPLLKQSIKSLLALLRPEDKISIIVYSEKARIALKPTSGANADKIAQVIDELRSDGDTDGNGGIRLAYKVANKEYIRAGNNRIILATDGEFPISHETYQLAQESASQDVFLTVFTFGRNEIKGDSLKKLARAGKGAYTHVTQANATGQLIIEAQAKKIP